MYRVGEGKPKIVLKRRLNFSQLTRAVEFSREADRENRTPFPAGTDEAHRGQDGKEEGCGEGRSIKAHPE